MTEHSPITPPPELVQELYGMPQMRAIEAAFKAGADTELEACIDVLGGQWEWDMLSQCTGWKEFRALSEEILRDARRPKLKTLKQQALQELDKVDMLWCTEDFDQVSQKALETIRRAIESIPDPS